MPNLRISNRGSIYVSVPKSEAAREALAQIGGRPVHVASDPQKTGEKTSGQKSLAYWSFKASGDMTLLRNQLSRISDLVPSPRPAARMELEGLMGIGLAQQGAVLLIETAILPRTLDILAPAQPDRLQDGTLSVRMDIMGGESVRRALTALEDYHRTILVPPHKPGTGIDLSEADIAAALELMPEHMLYPDTRGMAERIKTMLVNHFGSLDRVSLTPGADPVAVARLSGVAAHLTAIEAAMPRPVHQFSQHRSVER